MQFLHCGIVAAFSMVAVVVDFLHKFVFIKGLLIPRSEYYLDSLRSRLRKPFIDKTTSIISGYHPILRKTPTVNPLDLSG